jgi:hypothetical protein
MVRTVLAPLGVAKTGLKAVRTVVPSLGAATLAVEIVIASVENIASLAKLWVEAPLTLPGTRTVPKIVRTVVPSLGVTTVAVAVGAVTASTVDAAPLPKVRIVVAPLRVVTTVD